MIDYDKLKKNAVRIRAELFSKGIFIQERQKIRRKPRTPEKQMIILAKALCRNRKYRPYLNKEGRLILPYIFLQMKEQEIPDSSGRGTNI